MTLALQKGKGDKYTLLAFVYPAKWCEATSMQLQIQNIHQTFTNNH